MFRCLNSKEILFLIRVSKTFKKAIAKQVIYVIVIQVAPTRKTGGSTDGYKPLMLGQRLKALAFALLQPLCF